MSIETERDTANQMLVLAHEFMQVAMTKTREGRVILRDTNLTPAEWDARWQVFAEHMDEHHADGGACRHAIRGSE